MPIDSFLAPAQPNIFITRDMRRASKSNPRQIELLSTARGTRCRQRRADARRTLRRRARRCERNGWREKHALRALTARGNARGETAGRGGAPARLEVAPDRGKSARGTASRRVAGDATCASAAVGRARARQGGRDRRLPAVADSCRHAHGFIARPMSSGALSPPRVGAPSPVKVKGT